MRFFLRDLPAGRRRRIYRVAALLLAGLAAGVGGCAGSGSGAARHSAALAAPVRELLDRASERVDAGARDEALALCREALRLGPDEVAAHRALQNLELADHRRGELLLRYAAWRDADPSSSDRWYLWGRLLSSPERQAEAFERARTLDPRSPWPLLGLGHLALADGDTAKAIATFRSGRELAPDLPDLEIGLLRALLADPRNGPEVDRLQQNLLDGERWDVARVRLLAEQMVRRDKPRDALRLLVRLLARVPRNGEVAAAVADRFERDGTTEDAEFLRRELADAWREPTVRPLLARAGAMVGEAEVALTTWGTSPDLDRDERSWRRRLLVARGNAPAALALERERFAALAALGADTRAFDDAAALVATPDADPQRVAAAFRRLGWIDEAIAVLRPLADAAARPEAGEFLRELMEQRRFEAELEVLARETYRAFDLEKPPLALDAFLAKVGALARRSLGLELVDGAPHLDFWPIGELLDPTAPRGLAAWFRARGRLLVTGRRTGKPPELMLAPVVATMRAGPQDAEVALIDGVEIPGYLEHRGARFSGAALVRLVYLDVGAIDEDVTRLLRLERQLGPAQERIRSDPIEAAADRAARRAIDEPAEVALKLDFRGLAAWRERHPEASRASLLAESIDAVLTHERGHLEDAARYLPLTRHWPAILWEVAKLGFSPRRAEELLELRAECGALARARNPWFVLASCAAQLGGGEPTLTPHAGGYRELLERLVAVLDDDPAAFPSLRRDRVLVQQLDRLTEAELREAARRVLADVGVDAPAPDDATATPLRGAGR